MCRSYYYADDGWTDKNNLWQIKRLRVQRSATETKLEQHKLIWVLNHRKRFFNRIFYVTPIGKNKSGRVAKMRVASIFKRSSFDIWVSSRKQWLDKIEVIINSINHTLVDNIFHYFVFPQSWLQPNNRLSCLVYAILVAHLDSKIFRI